VGLRTIAEADLGAILEDSVTGFGFPITVTSPSGTVGALTGFTDDISQLIDPDTGQAVSGRLASIALRISTINSTFPGQGLPINIANAALKPWIVEFNDINGNPHRFKVSESNPDRAIGVLICTLELYA
jgi:hypothetical protein